MKDFLEWFEVNLYVIIVTVNIECEALLLYRDMSPFVKISFIKVNFHLSSGLKLPEFDHLGYGGCALLKSVLIVYAWMTILKNNKDCCCTMWDTLLVNTFLRTGSLNCRLAKTLGNNSMGTDTVYIYLRFQWCLFKVQHTAVYYRAVEQLLLQATVSAGLCPRPWLSLYVAHSLQILNWLYCWDSSCQFTLPSTILPTRDRCQQFH